jgi:PPOX class probable F420-dependent enzyme
MPDQPLADQPYISLETYKRDGTGVKTPVWCAPLDDTIVIFTEGKSFKVKRLRRNTRVRVAACDVRGTLQGDWSEGAAEIVESAEEEKRAYAALHRKYGWQMKTLDFFSTLACKIGKRKVLRVRLDDA